MLVLLKSNLYFPTTMSSYKILFIFFFYTFLSFSTTKAGDPAYLYHDCSSYKTFTAGSAYDLDLRTLFSSLSSNATGNTEFYNTVVAGRTPSDTIHGFFMCRGDVLPPLCRQCVVNAAQRLSSECRSSKEAIIWYDECLLRYSNRPFFSTVDRRPKFGLLNTANISDQYNFMHLLFRTMNETADEAAKFPIGAKKYATKQVTISGFQTLYCLAQCTPDLSPQDCRRCLSWVIGDLPWCCEGKQGGRVLYPSCNVRYELYPFYRSCPPAPSPVPGGLVPPSIWIWAKSEVAVLLFIVVICFLSKRAMKEDDSVPEEKAYDISNVEMQFDFSSIEAATNKFSAANKLAEGGFGEVYKGMLPSGKEIAVKRLTTSSG